jgi:hypothetical protein
MRYSRVVISQVAIKDLLDLILLTSVDDHWWWWRVMLMTWNGIWEC